ncbi:MAG: hypothetical protein IKX10_01670 [Lachnospiraceae bacterium]|nr:hypothetical protein [Lachnospiraceae bacterium]
MKKRQKVCIILFVSALTGVMLCGCRKTTASSTIETTAETKHIEGSIADVPVGDGVKEVVIGDEVKIITQTGKEYIAPLNKVASDVGIGSYTAAAEREKAKQENRILPAFPDVKFPLIFERPLPEWVKVYGGYAVTEDGQILSPSMSGEVFSGAPAETMEISAGMDPVYLNSDTKAYSQERYQVVKIIFEVDGQMYESYLFGKKGGAETE